MFSVLSLHSNRVRLCQKKELASFADARGEQAAAVWPLEDGDGEGARHEAAHRREAARAQTRRESASLRKSEMCCCKSDEEALLASLLQDARRPTLAIVQFSITFRRRTFHIRRTI